MTNGKCAYCGKPMTKGVITVDHVKPRCLGGRGGLNNLKICCRFCNTLKGSYDVEEFRKKISDGVKNGDASVVKKYGKDSNITFYFEILQKEEEDFERLLNYNKIVLKEDK